MLHVLKRHPVPVAAWFRHCLVLTYAFPEAVLRPLLPPGLSLDTHRDHGFVAIAMVQTEHLRPAALPACLGADFFLTGYRVFARYCTPEGRTLRGLRILRSDADRWPMVLGGNLLTHYHYRKCAARIAPGDHTLTVDVSTPRHEADVSVVAHLDEDAPLPDGSVFESWREARRFAGPLPFTFDYEEQSHSIIRIKGVRDRWDPRPVRVTVRRATFLDSPIFGGHKPALASAFHTAGIPYRWERGILAPLPGAGRETAA